MATSLEGRNLGKYKIVGLIGRGGMAAVYKGFQSDVERYVAIKVLPPHPGQDPQFVERFRLEARTIANMQHPNILPLYDYGTDDEILYLVMPYIEGGSITERITRGPMPVEEVERIVRQVASALDYAHRQGVVHRDIKPDNILLSSEGHATIADFGIVKMVAAGGSNLTATGGMVGTMAYMAPEQAQGKEVSAASDIYSFGVTVYEMLTGRQPYIADTPMQVMFKHISDPIPDIREHIANMPPDLSLVMQRVLAKDPDARYPRAGEFAVAFAKAVRGVEGAALVRDDAATQAQTPTSARPLITATEPDPERTMAGPTLAVSGESPTTLVTGQGGGSGGINRWLLLGGLGAVIVVAVLLVALLGGQGGGEVAASDTPAAAETGGATAAVAVVEDTATDLPTATPTDTPQPTQTPLPTATPIPTFGRVSFTTTNSLGDTVNLQVDGLAATSGGEHYTAWLVRTTDGTAQALGRVSMDAMGSGVLSYVDADARALPALFNAVLITREAGEAGDAPAGEVAYHGYVPVELTDALREILVASDDGVSGGSLLAGAIREAEIALQHAGLASGAGNIGGRHSHAEHTVNILLGTTDDLDGSGSGQNPGLGIGVVFFLDRIDGDLQAAADEAADWPLLQRDIELIRVCVANSRQWLGEAVTLEREMLGTDDFDATLTQATRSTELAAMLLNGTDLNMNGQIEPFEGECGLQQIDDYGVVLGAMAIQAGPLPEA
ncbi:MAG: protein kinase [Anaerolineae bacterium]|nr:protein kinase [Anaerolineae bacterium]